MIIDMFCLQLIFFKHISFLTCVYVFKKQLQVIQLANQKKKVLHDINLTGLLQNSLFLWKEEGKLIHWCFRAGNKQALFWVGAHKYFLQDQTKVRKEILFQANIEGDKNEKYGLAIALLYESNDEGI